MIFSAVEDIDTDLAFHHIGSLGGEINCWETFANLVLRDLRGVLKDLLSDLLWCWSAVFAVELDAKVFVQATYAATLGHGHKATNKSYQAVTKVVKNKRQRLRTSEHDRTCMKCHNPNGTWIVRGRQDEGSERHKATLTGANHGACRWSAQQSVLRSHVLPPKNLQHPFEQGKMGKDTK